MTKDRTKRAAAVLAKACALAVGWSLVATSAVDAALYWDTNGGLSGSGGPTPSGTWDNTTSNWSADATGSSPTQMWTPGESANFSAGSDATGQFTVTVNASQTAGGLTFQSGQAVLVGDGIVNTAGTISTASGANAAIQLVLGGNAALVVSGGGLLTLASANDYTGGTVVSGGSLDVKDNGSMSSGGVTVSNGAALLVDGAGLRIGNTISSLNGSGPTSIGAIRNLANNNTYFGNITLGSAARIQSDSGTLNLSGTINGNGLLTFGGAGTIEIAGVGALQTGTNGVTQSGTGVLKLSGNGSSTSTGTYTVAGGTMQLGANERIANTAPLSVQQSATFDMAGFNETVGSLSGVASGKIINLGVLTVGGNGTSTSFGGVISGSGNLVKVGSGTLTLTAANVDTGTTTISGGVIAISGVSAHLGGSQASVAGGSALILGNNAVVNLPITINGSGINNTGAIHRLGADTGTYSGPITLGSAAKIGNDGPSALVVSGTTNCGGFDLTLGGGGLISFSGSISNGGLIKDGTDVVLLLSSANTYRGNTSINAGKLIINGTINGTESSTTAVNSGGTLGGAGIINNIVTVNAGGHIAPGPATGGVATLDIEGGLTLLSQAVLEFELGTPTSSDKIAMAKSTLHLNGQQFSDFVFSKLSNFGPGMFTLIDAAAIDGSLGANVSGLIGTTPATLAIQGNDLVLIAPEPNIGLLVLAAAGFSVTGAPRRRRFSSGSLSLAGKGRG